MTLKKELCGAGVLLSALAQLASAIRYMFLQIPEGEYCLSDEPKFIYFFNSKNLMLCLSLP